MAGEKPRSEEKRERLAKALKANLARRKAQAKTRRSAGEDPGSPPDDDGCPN